VVRARTVAFTDFFANNFNTISLIPRTETLIATAVIKINVQGYVAVRLGE